MLNISFRTEDEIEFRTIALGAAPMILIEPEIVEVEGEDEDVVFNMDVAGLDLEGLHTVLLAMVEYLEKGIVDGSTVEGFEEGDKMSLTSTDSSASEEE